MAPNPSITAPSLTASVDAEPVTRWGRSPRRPHRAGAVLALAAGLAFVAGCGGDGESGSVTSTTVGSTVPASTTTVPEPLRSPEHPWVIAHRGSSALAPENTWAAFDLAVEQGADLIELDLQLTADGQLVVLHDPAPNRTARGPAEDCTGSVRALTLDRVTTCDAGTWFNEAHPDLARPAFADERVPSFDETLARYGTEVRWYIEIKRFPGDEGMEEAVVAALEAAGFTAEAPASAQQIVQSFDPASVRRMAELRPDLMASQLLSFGEEVDDARLDDIATYAVGIGPNWVDVTPELIAAAHARCLTVIPYTVDDPTQMTRLLDLGVDGIITNRPDLLGPIVDARPATAPPCP